MLTLAIIYGANPDLVNLPYDPEINKRVNIFQTVPDRHMVTIIHKIENNIWRFI